MEQTQNKIHKNDKRGQGLNPDHFQRYSVTPTL